MSRGKEGYNRIYAGINIDNLRYNVKTMKSLVKPDMKVLLVIKADAYGHGSVEVAKRTLDLADYFGVATIDEAVELRNAGIKTPILIIGYTDRDNYDKLIAYNITQAVYDVCECKVLSELACSMGKKAKVHIKVDTGMSRIGFITDENGINEAAKLADLEGLDIEGIFTHYAKADEFDKTAAKMQKEKFKWFIGELEKRGMSFSIKHIDNSAGTMELKDNEFDMIRLGIVTYGLYPSEEVDKSVIIKPVMSLVAHIAHIKTVPAGVGVSYGWTFVTDKDTKIATVTVGYADGYPRALSNKGKVIIHGKYAPILGRVCMDQIMVDVTDIPEAKLRDEVILIGNEGSSEITVEEVALPAASFNYELVCNISRRVPRVYYEEGKDNICVNYLI
ncbi:MAG: alanine racemase [Lachnospiraceae bacterium]|nr:alanine racemase [Lachnospiraceae bacterium]